MILSEDQLKGAIDFLTVSVTAVQGIYLFGSGIGEDFRAESDVDLAIISPSEIPVAQLWELKGELANITGREVDLIDLSQADTVLIYEVVAQGTRIYSSDIFESEKFEMLAFTQYFTLNQDRKEIIASINESGKIYG